MWKLSVLLALAAALPAWGANSGQPARAASSQCEAMAHSPIEGGAITGAALVPTAPSDADHPAWPIPPIPEHCRVTLTLRPTADSEIKAEVWLPTVGWNGRFLGVGVGGYAGVINELELKTAVQRGYAAAATDTGHGTEGTQIWARGHPEKVIDYGYRAIHLMTVAAKTVMARHYGVAAHHNYFSGCSNGGREALMEAVRYPADYDGIIAGAPAADIVGLFVASFGWNDQVQRRTPLTNSKLPAIGRAVLAQCDALDGASDGLVSAPEACHFEPAALRCKGKENDDCLTPAQVDALRAIYRGPASGNGQQLFPGYSVGGEVKEPPSPGWEDWLVPVPGQPTQQFNFFNRLMRDFVTADPDWTPDKFDLERDLAAARRSLAPVLNADDPDLSAFAGHGGKLILWHGWSDQVIPAQATILYYDRVLQVMGKDAAHTFSRLYLAPGMQHCWLGPGPWSFNWSAAKPGADPQGDMAAALEAWVEKNAAPQSLIAIRPKNVHSILAGYPPLEVERSGLLCPYPSLATFDGKGSSKDARSYSCVAHR